MSLFRTYWDIELLIRYFKVTMGSVLTYSKQTMLPQINMAQLV